ncbi:hypothetical protein KR222_000427, partial [Zaprionus bogoriensis]
RNNSIACLRAKAQEHQARLLNNGGLFLQVRSFAQAQAQVQAQAQSEQRNSNNSNINNCSSNQMLQLQQTVATSGAVKMEPTSCGGAGGNHASSEDV